MAVEHGPISKEYWLVTSTPNITSTIIRESFNSFVDHHMEANGLSAKSGKNQLDFMGSSAFKTALRKLFRAFQSKLEKDIPYLKADNLAKSFMVVSTNENRIIFTLLNDPSIDRYVRRMNRHLLIAKIPLQLTLPSETTLMTCRVDLRYANTSETTHRNLYLVMFYLDKFMTSFKTIQRKAIFKDAAARNHFNPARIRPGLL